MNRNYIDRTGERFGRLLVIERAPTWGVKWICRCDCGRMTSVRRNALASGNTKSCGCLHKERFTNRSHGHAKRAHGNKVSPEYTCWKNMKTRCEKKHRSYGERGIEVCDEWRDSFEQFLSDMGPRPSPKHTIERINNEGPYAPWNCRWATRSEQNVNRRVNCYVPFGVGLVTKSQACEVLGLNYFSVHTRMKKLGWSFEKAVTTPGIAGFMS